MKIYPIFEGNVFLSDLPFHLFSRNQGKEEQNECEQTTKVSTKVTSNNRHLCVQSEFLLIKVFYKTLAYIAGFRFGQTKDFDGQQQTTLFFNLLTLCNSKYLT